MINPARPLPGTRIARVEDVPEPGAIARMFTSGVAYYSLILSRRSGAVFAFENVCPHAGYPLERHDGRVVVQEGRYIVCTAHGASFALDGGKCAGGPCDGDALTPIPIEIVDGEIFISQASGSGLSGGA